MTRLLGVALVVFGLVGLLYGGLSWTREETVVDAGPIEITADDRESIPIPPIAGGLALVVGAVLLVKKRAA
jgi:hypothetical protein